jgi:hypothetical protein
LLLLLLLLLLVPLMSVGICRLWPVMILLLWLQKMVLHLEQAQLLLLLLHLCHCA